jgi:type VI secretion system secreted protein VgrG
MPAKPAEDTEVQIHPVDGGTYVNIESLMDIHVTAANDETIDITNDRTINVDGKHTETIKGDTSIQITQGNLTHDVVAGTANYHVQGAVTENYSDKQQTTAANEIEITSQTAHIILTGCTSIHLHVGDSQICMGSDGSIMISGKHVQIIGSDKVEISGGEVVSKADTTHEISGANVKSAATNTNTVSGATAVMLNP